MLNLNRLEVSKARRTLPRARATPVVETVLVIPPLTEGAGARLASPALTGERTKSRSFVRAEKCSEYRSEITGKSGGFVRIRGEGRRQQNPLRERVLLSLQFVSQLASEV